MVGGSAGAASASTTHNVKRELTVQVRDVAPTWHGTMPQGAAKTDARATDTDPTGCGNPWWIFEANQTIRTTRCFDQEMIIGLVVIVDGVEEPVGEATFTAEHVLTLNTTSLKWSEQVTITPAQLLGEAQTSPITLTLLTFNLPETTTTATGQLAGAFTVSGSSEEKGTIEYSSRVNKMQDLSDATHYVYVGEAAGFTTPTAIGYNGPTFRCDDAFWNKKLTKRYKVPGCVLPQQAATDTTPLFPSQQYWLPGIRQNIQTVQNAGVHVGKPFSGVPLHRTTEAQKEKNRTAVCGGLHPPQPGDSCDEYPFASTEEGGTHFNPPNRAIAWVPLAEQRKQGGIMRGFYSQSRILPGDPFYVNVLA
jgi:hypothetical protein